MGKLFNLLIIIFFTFFFTSMVFASSVYEEIENVINFEEVEKIDNVIYQQEHFNLSIQDIFENLILGNYDEYTFSEFLSQISLSFKNSINTLISLFTNIILIVVLQGFLGAVASSFKTKSVAKIGSYIIYIAFLTSIISIIYDLVVNTTSYLSFASDFTFALIPLYTSILTLNLKVTTATVMAPIILILSKVIIYLYSNILVNLVYIFSVVNLINLITEKDILNNYINISIKLIKSVVKYCTQGYILLISLIGIGTPIANTLLLKTSKYAVKSVPVIGNTLGSAMDSMTLLGDTTKRGFVVAIIIISIVILINYLIKIFLTNLVFYLASIVISPVAEKNIIKALNTSITFFEILISICVSTAVMITYSMLIILFI